MPLLLEQNLGGHSVLVVGYVDANNYLIIRNSWESAWSDNGYFYMPYDYLTSYTFDYWIMNK